MIIISLGYTCYVKDLINLTKYKKESDIFDWMNSFEFNKMINCLDGKCNIFDNIIQSPLIVDQHSSNVYFNELYSLRLPHEKNINESKYKYNRRYERLLNYKNDTNTYLCIRLINGGRYGINPEVLENNYNERCFNRIMSYLPPNSKILLLSESKMTQENLNKIFQKFIIVDDCIDPAHVFYGKFLQNKNVIINCYKSCFDYIDKNFDVLDVKKIYNFIKNENIYIT